MLNSLQVVGLVGFNVVLLIMAIVAVRLIGGGSNGGGGLGRRGGQPDELFSFDSWSDSGRTPRPMTDARRSDRDGR